MPPGVVTVTSTVPVPAGLVATICVPESLRIVANPVPKFTVAVLTVPRFVPLIVTVIPPAVGPAVGLMVIPVGASM